MTSKQILEIINDERINDKNKIECLYNILNQLTKSELLLIFPSSITSDFKYRYIIELIKIELLIINYNGEEEEGGKNIIGELISGINKKMIGYKHDLKDFKSWFIKIKLPDLQSDYQYLIKDLNYENFIDLINKKLLIINGIPKNESEFEDFIKRINLKILQLYLINCYDFRNGNILNYLNDNLKIDNYNHEIFEIINQTIINNPFVFKNSFEQIINYDFNNGYFKLIKNYMNIDNLYLNIIENNIIKLSNYFTLIKINTIYDILQIDENSIDLEAFIFQMIIKNKFNNEVKINQLEQTIDFNNKFEYSMEDHIKYIGKVINDV